MHISRLFALCGALLALLALPLQAAPSLTVSIGGAVNTPQVLDAAALRALSSITQTVSYQSGRGPQTHTYTGPSLWSVLQSASPALDVAVKNDSLAHYVLATATDGYKVVYSLGELDPGFGNRQALLAHSEVIDGLPRPLSPGVARTTMPGDVKGGRYVSAVASLDIARAAGSDFVASGGRSTAISVGGDVLSASTFDLAALQALTPTSTTAGGVRYTGVSFWDLLNGATGLAIDPAVKNDLLGMYAVATGSDGYRVAFSLGELSPDFGNQPVLIAYEADGELLDDAGFARIIVPNDVKRGRYVSNLARIEVFHAAAVPEPQTWALMLGGLLLTAGVARRRHSAVQH